MINSVRESDISLPELTFVVFTRNYIFELLGKLSIKPNIVINVSSLRNFIQLLGNASKFTNNIVQQNQIFGSVH